MSALQTFLEGIEVGAPVTSRNLQLVPLRRKTSAPSALDYMLASEALDRGVLRIAEVSETSSVPELRAVSEADIAILLLDGEELIGAKQNRILNTDVLLRPHGKKTIPVSCVEQGRWHHTRADFEMGSCSPSMLRARKSRAVTSSLRASGRAMADQGEVWDEVGAFLAKMNTPSDTAAMADAFEQREDDLSAIVADLPYMDDAVGVIAMIGGRFAVLDLFDRPGTLQQAWSRLVTGYAADALARTLQEVAKAEKDEATAILDRVRRVDCTVCSGVDLGEDWRFESAETVGSALVMDGTALHVSAFPAEPDLRDSGGGEGRIASPSERRRRRG